MMKMMGENIEAVKKRELLRSKIDSIGLASLIEKDYESVDPEMTLSDVVAKMRAKDLHEVPVIDGSRKLLGVISYRNIIRRRNLVIGMKAKTILEQAPLITEETRITEVAEHFISTGYRQLPVVKGNKLVGLVSRAGIISIIPKIKDLRNLKAKELMTTDVATVSRNDSIKKALEIMRRLDIRTLPVVDDDERLVGIIGIKDMVNYFWGVKDAQKIGERSGNNDPVEIKVGSLAVDNVYTISPEDDVGSVVKLMTSKNVSALPVVERDKIQGILTMYDLVELVASFREREMVYMQITGLEEEDRFSLDIMEKEIQSGLAKISKITKPQLFTLHVTKHHSTGNRAKYSLSGRLFTENGAFIAKSVDWSLIKATVDLMNILDAKVMEMKEERLDKKKKPRKEI
ncbi:MAG: CBS domain-containing protein [Methanomassiliicoccales archaeon]